MAIFLAALADPVETTIYGADILKRRYPDIIEKYHSLGAKVTLVE
jgi:UDP-N-acetylglucosamine enolpyruvyl transferase